MHLKLLYEKISTLQPKKLDAMIKMKKKIEFEFFSFKTSNILLKYTFSLISNTEIKCKTLCKNKISAYVFVIQFFLLFIPCLIFFHIIRKMRRHYMHEFAKKVLILSINIYIHCT